MLRLVRLLAAAVLGYIVIALGQVVFLELLLDGAVRFGAPIGVLAAGIGGTVVSGLVGGAFAARIGGAEPRRHAAVVLAPLGLDAFYVVTRGSLGDPLWFDLGGALTLMAATLVGGWLYARRASGPTAGARQTAGLGLPSAAHGQ